MLGRAQGFVITCRGDDWLCQVITHHSYSGRERKRNLGKKSLKNHFWRKICKFIFILVSSLGFFDYLNIVHAKSDVDKNILDTDLVGEKVERIFKNFRKKSKTSENWKKSENIKRRLKILFSASFWRGNQVGGLPRRPT